MALKDIFRMNITNDAPARNGYTATPDDDNDLPHSGRALWVGGEGTVAAVTVNGDSVTLAGCVGVVPVSVRRILATGTTATDIVVLY